MNQFIFEYDMFAAERGFEMEKFMFSQEDWREYERDHEPTSEDFEPPTERMPERRSFPMPEDYEPLLGLDIGSEIVDSDCIIT